MLPAAATTLLFYDQATGESAFGEIGDGKFETTQTFPAGFFAPGWTHILDILGDYALFYREPTGEGAVVGGVPAVPTNSEVFPSQFLRPRLDAHRQHIILTVL